MASALNETLRVILIDSPGKPFPLYFTAPCTLDAMKMASLARASSCALDLSIMARVTGYRGTLDRS